MSGRIVKDTTEFFSIDYGDIILVDSKRYKVTGHEREGRFGMDDPKFWVKKVVDLDTGEKKIAKLSHFEAFESSIGGVKIRRFRNPDKESDVLNRMKNHPHFMHGTSYRDSKENNVRILDIVRGQGFFDYIQSFEMDYDTYFSAELPRILRELIKAFEAIRFLHANGFKHGDIRNDHIIIESNTGNYVWIDFDYDYETIENPYGLDVFGLGNILMYAIGKGFHHCHEIKRDGVAYKDLKNLMEAGDVSILDRGRFINLRKLYPIIPKMLNDILMHFSMGTDVYYEFAEEIVEDLTVCLYSVFE
ncbi:MAG: hypothetical protein V2J25_02540 [Desulfatiglans sp.]|nr:protein kinase [Thermodesulfobacteriota bacterium]MEE4351723.1 hypothetical protein [Desulfatiglans sp.]